MNDEDELIVDPEVDDETPDVDEDEGAPPPESATRPDYGIDDGDQ